MRARHRSFLISGCTVLMMVGCSSPPPPPAPPVPPAPPPPTPAAKSEQPPAGPESPPEIPLAEVDTPPSACAERDKELRQLYAPYLDAFSNYGIELSPDGKTLLFLSNRGGGSDQLYVARAAQPRSRPTVIARAKDGVSSARFTPDGKYIVFTRDHNKDENTQIFRATPDGKEVVPLTSNPKGFHRMPKMSADGKTLVYLRGSHKSSRVTLVTQSIAGGEAREVTSFDQGYLFVSDLSADGKRALVFELSSLSASRQLLVELDSGKTRQLAPTAGKKAHAHTARFSADEKHVYLVTDENGERAGLHKLELQTGKVTASFYDDEAEVADVEVSAKLPVLAVLMDAGSHHSVKLLDAKTLRDKTPVKLPLGRVSLGRFSSDGRSVVLTVSTPSQPSEAFRLDVRSGRVRPLRREPRKGLGKLGRVRATVQRVPSFDGLEVPINVYLPWRLPRGKKLPVIVWVHGGPAAASTIRYNPFASFWISRGFAVVEPNVRGSTGFGKAYEKADNLDKRMDAVKDLDQVNGWIRQQTWADPERLVVAGGSYGGYMTYMGLGHQSERWACGIGLVGVVNLRTLVRTTSGTLRKILEAEFGQLKTESAFLDSVSPIKVADRIRAPLFVYQGANDPRVPRSEQDQLIHALRARKIPVEYMLAADEGHSISQRHNKLEFISRSMRFLEQHLSLPGAPEGCRLKGAE